MFSNKIYQSSGQSSITHQLFAVLLSRAGAEQLHVEEGKNSQQLRLQVVRLSHNNQRKESD